MGVGIIASSPVTGQLATSDWPMFHRNLTHTGLSPAQGSTGFELAWSYSTVASVESPPSIGPGGVVYVGSRAPDSGDAAVYSFNSDG